MLGGQAARYSWKYHKRLRIKLINAEGHETVVPQLVLNEVSEQPIALVTVADSIGAATPHARTGRSPTAVALTR